LYIYISEAKASSGDRVSRFSERGSALECSVVEVALEKSICSEVGLCQLLKSRANWILCTSSLTVPFLMLAWIDF
jgi:hypothetical protein